VAFVVGVGAGGDAAPVAELPWANAVGQATAIHAVAGSRDLRENFSIDIRRIVIAWVIIPSRIFLDFFRRVV
jgi:hypothetical protein